MFCQIAYLRLERRYTCIGCICLTFLHCASLNVSSNHLPESGHSRIGCICLTFHHCAYLNVSSNHLPESRHSRIGCICLTFHHCASLNVSSNHLPESRHSRIGCICLTFLHCGSLNVSLNCLPKEEVCLIFLHCACHSAVGADDRNGFSPLWATNFLQCVLKSKIIIPRPSSVPSSVKRPAHWLQSFSLRLNIPMMKGASSAT